MTDLPVRQPVSWDIACLKFALVIAEKSKDPSTQVGAILSSPDRRTIVPGYNGFGAPVDDDPKVLGGGATASGLTKHDLVIHAEVNALLNCACRPVGWTLYLTHLPCASCATVLSGSGVTRIVALDRRGKSDLCYGKSFSILSEAGIRFETPKMQDLPL